MSVSSTSSSVSRKQELLNQLQTQNSIEAENSLFSDYGSRKRVLLLDYAPITSSPDKKVRKLVKGGLTSFNECYPAASRYMVVSYGK